MTYKENFYLIIFLKIGIDIIYGIYIMCKD